MSSPTTPELPVVIQLPIVISAAAWRNAVLLESRDPPERLFRDRLRRLLCAAYSAHLGYPHTPHGDVELPHTPPADQAQNAPCLRLRFSLLQEARQPAALLIALAEEDPR
jgi:hypothetical protein